MEMIEAILIIILLSIWLVFSVVFLITAIQNFINAVSYTHLTLPTKA